MDDIVSQVGDVLGLAFAIAGAMWLLWALSTL